MRKIAILVIIALLSIVAIVVIIKARSIKPTSKNAIAVAKTSLPLFEFIRIEDSTTFSKYDIDKNKATVITYFSPDCDLCDISAKAFNQLYDIHKKSQVLYVSSADIEQIKQFRLKFRLDEIPNIQFYYCDFDSFYRSFGDVSTPSYFIYFKGGKHMKTINDNVPLKILFSYIKAVDVQE